MKAFFSEGESASVLFSRCTATVCR